MAAHQHTAGVCNLLVCPREDYRTIDRMAARTDEAVRALDEDDRAARRAMERDEIACYVLPFFEDQTSRGRLFCSPECGGATLEYPPDEWTSLRHTLSRAVAVAVYCEGCGLSLTELHDEAERERAEQRT